MLTALEATSKIQKLMIQTYLSLSQNCNDEL